MEVAGSHGCTSTEEERHSAVNSCSLCSLPALPSPAAMPGLGLPPAPKPFLGGFRSRKTGLEFHHATCQTDAGPERRAAREASVAATTQTAPRRRAAAVETSVDAHTQVPRDSWYADMSGCKVVEPRGEHETAEQWAARRAAAATTVQRWWRGGQGRQRAAALRTELADAAEGAARAEAEATAAAAAAAEHEVRRRMQPRTRSDFEILYEELGAWWGSQTAAIKGDEALAPQERHAALEALLAKETRLLQTIDKLKIKAALPNRAERVGRLLAGLAAPKRWPAHDGGVMEVVTPETTRAAELAAAYSALVAPWQGLEPRLAALLAAKLLAKEADCSLAREVVSLLDREADLLHRGRSPDTMAGLRQRLANRFLALTTMPAFNPAAAALALRVADTSTMPAWPPMAGGATEIWGAEPAAAAEAEAEEAEAEEGAAGAAGAGAEGAVSVDGSRGPGAAMAVAFLSECNST